MPDALPPGDGAVQEEYAVIRFSAGDQPTLALNEQGRAGWVLVNVLAPTMHTREAWFRRAVVLGA
jgi:hypothetical protein